MRQMMWGDVEADTVHMKPMHAFTSQQVVFSPDRRLLDGMPSPARSGLLSVIAAYLPYYTSEREVPFGASYCLEECHASGAAAALMPAVRLLVNC
jgi:hypothetical protein